MSESIANDDNDDVSYVTVSASPSECSEDSEKQHRQPSRVVDGSSTPKCALPAQSSGPHTRRSDVSGDTCHARDARSRRRGVGQPGTRTQHTGFHIGDAPTYRKIPHRTEHHGHVRVDPYFWLRDKGNSRVKKLLHRENNHVERFFRSHQPHLRRRLFAEMRARHKEEDASLPVRDRHYWYYCRHVPNEEHALYCRRPYDPALGVNLHFDHEVSALWLNNPQAALPCYDDEVVYLDLNLLQQTLRLDYIDMGDMEVAPDESQLAVTLDCSGGREVYTLFVLRIRDVRYADWVQHAAGAVHRAWAEQRMRDGQSIYGSPTTTQSSFASLRKTTTTTTTTAAAACSALPTTSATGEAGKSTSVPTMSPKLGSSSHRSQRSKGQRARACATRTSPTHCILYRIDSMPLASEVLWASDSALLYLALDDKHRPYQLFHHNLTRCGDDCGSDGDAVVLCFEEEDEAFWVGGLGLTSDAHYFTFSTSSSEVSETYLCCTRAGCSRLRGRRWSEGEPERRDEAATARWLCGLPTVLTPPPPPPPPPDVAIDASVLSEMGAHSVDDSIAETDYSSRARGSACDAVGAGAMCFAVRQHHPPLEYDLDHHCSLLTHPSRKHTALQSSDTSMRNAHGRANCPQQPLTRHESDEKQTPPPPHEHDASEEGVCPTHQAHYNRHACLCHKEQAPERHGREEQEGAWVIVTNAHTCDNFTLCLLPDAAAPTQTQHSGDVSPCDQVTRSTMQWLPLVAYSPDVMVMGVECWRDFLLLSVRRSGAPTVLFCAVTHIQSWWQAQQQESVGCMNYNSVRPMRVEDWLDLAALLAPPRPPTDRAGRQYAESVTQMLRSCALTRPAIDAVCDEVCTDLPYCVEACRASECFDAMTWRVEVTHLTRPAVQYEMTYCPRLGRCRRRGSEDVRDGNKADRTEGACPAASVDGSNAASRPGGALPGRGTPPHARLGVRGGGGATVPLLDGMSRVCVTQRLLRREWVPGTPAYNPDDYDGVVVWVPSNYAFPPAHFTNPTPPTHPSSSGAEAADAASPPLPARRLTVRLPAPTDTPAEPVRVPVFLCWRRDTFVRGDNPLLLRVYGAYGDCSDACFAPARLCLLDRGFVWGMSAVRGGGELGIAWRDAGRKLQRGTSVNDFISVAAYMQEHRWCAPGKVISSGDSAGGFVVFAAMNYAPHVFGAVIGGVPFVDCLTTLLDDSLPLTITEWDEFGNPAHDARCYHLLRALSPTESVPRCAILRGGNDSSSGGGNNDCGGGSMLFPHVMMLTSWSDTRVGHWESMKLTARLREVWAGESAGRGRVLLHYCDFASGHGGAAGRYGQLREIAREYAFAILVASEWG